MERDLDAIFGLGERGAQVHAERQRIDNPWDRGNPQVAFVPAERVEYLPPAPASPSPIPALVAVSVFLIALIGSAARR